MISHHIRCQSHLPHSTGQPLCSKPTVLAARSQVHNSSHAATAELPWHRAQLGRLGPEGLGCVCGLSSTGGQARNCQVACSSVPWVAETSLAEASTSADTSSATVCATNSLSPSQSDEVGSSECLSGAGPSSLKAKSQAQPQPQAHSQSQAQGGAEECSTASTSSGARHSEATAQQSTSVSGASSGRRPGSKHAPGSGFATVYDIRNAAKAKRRAGRLHAALAIIDDGLARFPDNPDLLALAAPIHTKLGNPQRALELLAIAMERHPRNLRFVTAAAAAEGRLGNFERARELYQRGIELYSGSAHLFQSWAMTEASAGNERTARELFQSALHVSPNSGACYNAWALFEASLGNASMARQLWQDGAMADPDHTPLLHAWAEYELSQEGFTSHTARELLASASELDATHLPSCLSLGRLDWMAGNHDSARGWWGQGIGNVCADEQFEEGCSRDGSLGAIDMSAPGALVDSGSIRRDMLTSEASSNGQDNAKGSTSSMSANELAEVPSDQSSAHALVTWARFELRSQNLVKARELLSRALELDPGNVHALQVAALMEDRAGNMGKANLIYTKMMDMSGVVLGPAEESNALPLSEADAEAGAEPVPLCVPDSERATSAGVSDLKGASPQLLHARAQFFLKRGRLEEAEIYLQAMELLDPCNGHLCHTRGQLAVSCGDVQSAMGWFERGIGLAGAVAAPALGSSSAKGVLLCLEGRGKLLSFQGKEEAARATFEAGLQLLKTRGGVVFAPGNVSARAPSVHSSARSRAGVSDGGFEGARRRSMRMPGSVFGASDIAESVSGSTGISGPGVVIGPTASTGPGLALGPTGISASAAGRFFREYALFEKHCARYEEASELFRRAARVDPQDYKTWMQWAVLERRRRRYDVAELCFQRGVALAPGNPHLWYAYAVMLWKASGIGRARAVFRQATEHCARSAPLWMEWALMEWRSGGDIDTARRLMERGSKVPIAYQHPPLYVAWSEIETEAGFSERAAKLLQMGTAVEEKKQDARSNIRTARS